MKENHLALLKIIEDESDYIWLGKLQKKIEGIDSEYKRKYNLNFRGNGLYTVLDRLEKKGLIKSEKRGITPQCPQYKFVRISEKGRLEISKIKELFEISRKNKEKTEIKESKKNDYDEIDRGDLILTINNLLGAK